MRVSDLEPRQLTEGLWTFGEFNPKSIITDAELDRSERAELKVS